ncbi:uncharacterized protein LAESUDRAFT_757208 [Laetiporus sulphureus 93-53]|uniref:Uncharacterized protein n=1 Tax=Laetiporus sulphureus 93-53 TaxID=1314785 RepID=A0A165FIU7_9APHY|nr:uncharacterized protein LAESUDRAFT_757208 [Laetiporus sulphureus 93-53]KZT09036.1 hypothetical protein LAESUDRAFT_757208 [Laetiporus sulphureus 93-53]
MQSLIDSSSLLAAVDHGAAVVPSTTSLSIEHVGDHHDYIEPAQRSSGLGEVATDHEIGPDSNEQHIDHDHTEEAANLPKTVEKPSPVKMVDSVPYHGEDNAESVISDNSELQPVGSFVSEALAAGNNAMAGPLCNQAEPSSFTTELDKFNVRYQFPILTCFLSRLL